MSALIADFARSFLFNYDDLNEGLKFLSLAFIWAVTFFVYLFFCEECKFFSEWDSKASASSKFDFLCLF